MEGRLKLNIAVKYIPFCTGENNIDGIIHVIYIAVNAVGVKELVLKTYKFTWMIESV